MSARAKKIALICLIVFAGLAVLGGVATGIYFGVTIVPTSGVVLEEGSNTPIANVAVTDGKNVVKTDKNGVFELPGWHKARFVTITNPTGYWTEDYYKEIDRNVKEYKFYLTKTDDKTNHTFMQISDTEISDSGVGDWFKHLKSKVDELKPAFLIHTGDICYEAGLRQHINDMNSENMNVPVRYVIGNHDFVKYGSYGEQLFEDIYGPVNYSFDIGNVHYIVSSIAHGDYPAKYTYSDVVRWVENDLKQVDAGKKVVIFNHDVCRDETGMVMKSGTRKIELAKQNVIAWINGHLHYNFINNYDGILNISTAPLVGGIDGSIGGVRLVDVEGDKIVNTYMSYTDYHPTDSEAGYEWQTKLAGANLYTDPQLVNGKIYVGMMDNSLPRKPVFACLNLSGEVVWQVDMPTSIKNDFYIYQNVAVVQDSSGIVYGLDLDSNGKKLWEKDMKLITYRYAMQGITGEGDRVYCGNSRFVYCFNVKNGEQLWRANYGSGEPSPYKLQIIGNRLIVGDHWRSHYALDKNTGKKKWDIGIRTDAVSSAVEYNGGIYVFEGGNLLQINPENGKIIKQIEVKSNIGGDEHGYNFNVGSKPVIDGNIAYVGTNNKGLIAINMTNLSVVWECNTGANMIYATPYSGKGSAGVQGGVILSEDKLYFGGMDGYLYIASKNSGEILDKYAIGSPILSKVILAVEGNQKFVIASDFEGRVTRINLNQDGKFLRIMPN